jgi:hypothetical protein
MRGLSGPSTRTAMEIAGIKECTSLFPRGDFFERTSSASCESVSAIQKVS